MQNHAQVTLTGLFGHPVRHSRSPQMQNSAFHETNLPFQYMAFDVAPERLGDAVAGIRALNMRGVNVTIPHKVEVMQYLDQITPEAELIGAVNTIVNENGLLIGHNTDGSGYVRSLIEETQISLADTSALILGAGGAARAVASALALNGVKELYIMNRTPQKSAELAHRVSRHCPVRAIGEADLAQIIHKVRLIVNTTSVGMHPAVNDSPIAGEFLHAGMVVSDLIYNPRETLLLQQAKQQGAVTHGGLGMFVYQGAQAFTLWTGVEAPVQTMRKAAEAVL